MRSLVSLLAIAVIGGCSIEPRSAGLLQTPPPAQPQQQPQQPPQKAPTAPGTLSSNLTANGWAATNSAADAYIDAGTPDVMPPDSGPPVDDAGPPNPPPVDAGTPAVAGGSVAFGTPYVVSTSVSTWSLTTADLNNDGLDDVVKTGWAEPAWTSLGGSDGVALLLGISDGGMVAGSGFDEYGVVFSAVGDLNGDGWMDIASAGNGGVFIKLSRGDGTFATDAIDSSSIYATYEPQIADLDGDGRPDIVVCSFQAVSIFFDDGGAYFPQPVTLASTSCRIIATADLDGDGNTDIVTVENNTDLVVRLGIGDGGFLTGTTYATANLGWIAVHDFNGDGRPDVVWGNGSGIGVRLNAGGGALGDEVDFAADPPASYSWQVAVADLNGDGLPDVASAGGPDCDWDAGGGAWVFLNDGDGGFTTGSALATDPTVVISGITAWLPAGSVLPSLIVGDFCDGNMSVFPNTTGVDGG